MRYFSITGAAILSLGLAGAALAQGGPPCGSPPCGSPPEEPGQWGTDSELLYTYEKEVDLGSSQFMGMSDRTPPNENAAASRGVRTETTTRTDTMGIYQDYDVPPGQIGKYDEISECEGCQKDGDPYEELIEEGVEETAIEGPGNRSHD